MSYSSLCKILYLSAMLVLMAACASANQSGASEGNPGTPRASNPCERPSAIKGSVVSVSHATAGKFLGGLLLDGTREQNAAFAQVYASVRNTAQVYEKQGNECRAATFTSIKTGQRIQIQSTGTVLQSYPPQIEAVEIVIISS
jgi:Protein of unknown function (DUF3221)